MTVIHLKKKDVVKSSVKGIKIKFDHLKLASILGIPSDDGICEYIKDVWEESKYTKPLEIIRRFANDETLTAARRVKSCEMKSFQRFIHFLVMKNVVPRFGKRDTSSFMDLTYMDHLMARRLVNLPRVMMRHMIYVIFMKDHELPYGDWLTMVFEEFGVPLVDKKGEEPKSYDYFEKTFLTMCKLKRENGVWWVGAGEKREEEMMRLMLEEEKWENLFKRRELVHVDAVNEFYEKMTVIHLKKKDVVKSSVKGIGIEFDHERLATILGVPGRTGICEYIKEVWEESKYTKPLDITRRIANDETITAARRVKSRKSVIDEATIEGNRGSDDQFYDAQVEVEEPSDETQATLAVPAPSSAQQKDKEPSGVDPSCPTGKIPEAEFLKFQAEFERKRANKFHDDLDKAKAENARLLALLHQAQTKPHP
ncbi:hypothetical protein Dimus_008276 [Dionaea muscipula]